MAAFLILNVISGVVRVSLGGDSSESGNNDEHRTTLVFVFFVPSLVSLYLLPCLLRLVSSVLLSTVNLGGLSPLLLWL